MYPGTHKLSSATFLASPPPLRLLCLPSEQNNLSTIYFRASDNPPVRRDREIVLGYRRPVRGEHRNTSRVSEDPPVWKAQTSLPRVLPSPKKTQTSLLCIAPLLGPRHISPVSLSIFKTTHLSCLFGPPPVRRATDTSPLLPVDFCPR